MKRNRSFILNIMSDALMVFGISLVPPVIAALAFGESEMLRVLVPASLICFGIGFSGRTVSGAIEAQVRPRIWYMTTFFTWMLLICITVPVFYFGIPGSSAVDAFFDSCASWTTTGIDVYDTPALPKSLQLVRASFNWLGGVGIIMTILSLVPTRQFLGYGLVSTEFPGPSFLKSEGPFRKGYRKVVLIYILLTLVQFILLVLAGMPVFTSVLTALSNTGTAGLRHIQNGMAAGLAPAVKLIITFFALICSVSCVLLLLVMERRIREIRKHSEIRLYLFRLLATAVIITFFVVRAFPERRAAGVFADVAMQTVSFLSTSGYIITDCNSWPEVCRAIIMLQMFIGACAVSTGGGIKEARIIIGIKSVSLTIYRHIHPSSIRSMTFNKKPLTNDQIVRANLFIALFMITYLAGALLITLGGAGLSDALCYSQAMITNTGSFIGQRGAPDIAESFSPFTKIVMSFLMIAGRLEIYPFVMIFLRNFWKSDSVV